MSGAQFAMRTTESAVSLNRVLNRRPWVLCNDPFPHIRAEEVFIPEFYRELETAFEEILGDSGSPTWPEARLTRNMPGYDAFGADFDTRVRWPLSFLQSREWHDFLARLFAVDAVGCMSVALHHHSIGSRDGFAHNDLNPGWFVRTGADIDIPRGDMCHYRTGAPANANVRPVEMIRGVALVYYLNNLPWQPGDGGETGLFRAPYDVHPVVSVPPINNSLVAFECTPQSFHAFRSNHRYPRNSISSWVHRDKSTVVARWGEAAIVRWR